MKTSFIRIVIVLGVACLALGGWWLYKGQFARAERPPRTAAQKEAVAWLRQHLQASYDQVGSKNPQWDAEMGKLIEIAAETRGYQIVPQEPRLHEQIAVVRDLGCNDPLFKYWDLRFRPPPVEPVVQVREPALPICEALMSSKYSPLEKFWAARWAHWDVKKEENLAYVKRIEGFVLDALKDGTVPMAEVRMISEYLIDSARSYPELTASVYPRLRASLNKHWAGKAESLALEGLMEIHLAWQARGWKSDAGLTPDRAEGFRLHLEKAHDLFERSWQVSPNSMAATKMLSVRLGYKTEATEMEKWFQHAMQMDPDNSEACIAKIRYLRPRWHGTHEEMIAFGRECLRNRKWGPNVALMIHHAYATVAEDMPKSAVDEMYRRRRVYNELQAGWDIYLHYFPQDDRERTYYFWQARLNEDWDKALDLIEEIKAVYPDQFRDLRGFQWYLDEASVKKKQVLTHTERVRIWDNFWKGL